jgi:hypothetical protein
VRDSLPESKNFDNFDNPSRKGEVSADHFGTLLLEQGLTLSILEIRNFKFHSDTQADVSPLLLPL